MTARSFSQGRFEVSALPAFAWCCDRPTLKTKEAQGGPTPRASENPDADGPENLDSERILTSWSPASQPSKGECDATKKAKALEAGVALSPAEGLARIAPSAPGLSGAVSSPYFLPAHRAAAALRALAARSSGVSFAARAVPPFCPPLRPAAAFGESGSGSAHSGSWCVAFWKILKATCVKSGFLLMTFGVSHGAAGTGPPPCGYTLSFSRCAASRNAPASSRSRRGASSEASA